MLKRIFDLIISSLGLLVLLLPLLIIAFTVRLTSKGPVIHWSKRVGKNSKIFLMPKFRTMRTDAPQVATHLLKDSSSFLTPVGNFLRKSSLDELPQLWSVLCGQMSLVGPRPALFNQDDLVQLRQELKVDTLKPGITGWAQINGRDELPIPIKVSYDEYYLNHHSLWLDLKILFLTIYKAARSEGITH